jgi:hypothetical protein
MIGWSGSNLVRRTVGAKASRPAGAEQVVEVA